MYTPITLNELLASRDARHAMQMQLLAAHPEETLVCLTVVMPGSVKRNSESLLVAQAAVESLRVAFRPGHGCLLERDLPTGYEAYLLVPTPLTETKRKTCDIEDNHPLGRLFDIDVIDHNGQPVSRALIGRAPRRCLLCDREARLCMRLHTHTQEELWQRIRQMTEAYEQRD